MGIVGVLGEVGAGAAVGFTPQALHFESADGDDLCLERELTARKGLRVVFEQAQCASGSPLSQRGARRVQRRNLLLEPGGARGCPR